LPEPLLLIGSAAHADSLKWKSSGQAKDDTRLKPRLLLSDIDGTLLDNEGGLPLPNLRALETCRHRQVTVTLATGRRWSTARKLLDRLNLWPWVDFAILNNGMVVQDLRSGKSLAAHAFSPALARNLSEGLAAMGMDPILLSHAQDGISPDVHFRSLSLLNEDFVAKNRQQSRAFSDWSDIAAQSLVEILLVGFKSDLEAAQAWLAQWPVETALIRNSFYREWMLEMTPKGFDKASGAAFLQGHLGIASQECMAIGDSANDLPLFRAADHSVAMEEAPEEVRMLAQRTTLSNQIGGMGLAVMEWLNGVE
jgi:Cof subfamily protein (haloacid dehalogenase superfamily)